MDAETVPPSLVAAFRDRYELTRETGRGGSATVYLARDLKHDRLVAIKVLNPDFGPTSGDRFLREIRVSAGMQHPHILPTYDSGIADGRLYFVMPFVDGGSLRERLDATSSLPVNAALSIARDIAIALTHAHGLGVVHRDVKPENIMFYHGTACLADFGIARAIEEMEPGITAHGTFVGTPAYMSPEQYAAVGFDGRSDVYSLACVLYEMIAGARLFAGGSVREVLAERVVGHTGRKLRPKLPSYIDALLDRGLASLPEHRFPDAAAFVSALQDALRQQMMGTEPASTTDGKLGPTRQHKLAYALAAAAIVLLAGLAWSPLRHELTRLPASIRAALSPAVRRPFEAGQIALAGWDIPGAQTAFAAAAAEDPAAPAARLWLAESYALDRRSKREEFRASALRLETVRAQLKGRDSLLAEALFAIATGKPAIACDMYAKQLQRDPVDVLAWYGMGECQSIDSTVVSNRLSPSGWSFRSSNESAARAYMRAVTLAPGAHAAIPYEAVATLLPSDVASVRVGRSAGPAGETFAAYPAVVADTIAFVPYPLAAFSLVGPSTISQTQADALKHDRDVLLEFARDWAAAAPRSADAWEALALAREGRGDLADDGEGAAAAILRARSLTSIPLQQTQLGAAQVRVYVKRGEFRRASVIADSILDAWGGQTAPQNIAVRLSGLAALTGRVQLTSTLMATANSPIYASLGIAPPLNAAASRFFARAAPGVCDDTLALLRRDFERVLDSYAPPNRKDQIRRTVLWQGAALSFPCLLGGALAGLAPSVPLDRAQRAFAAHDVKRTRMLLDSLGSVRSVYRPGDISLDHTVQEAWLRAAAGDSAGAERQLDLVLDALPTLGTQAVRETAQSAAVGRAMVLRAELAGARHDTATAHRWAKGALELWTKADASLKPTLDRMKVVAGRQPIQPPEEH